MQHGISVDQRSVTTLNDKEHSPDFAGDSGVALHGFQGLSFLVP